MCKDFIMATFFMAGQMKNSILFTWRKLRHDCLRKYVHVQCLCMLKWSVYSSVLFVHVLQLEDCALQLYKYNSGQGDYGTYLDLESSLEEQYDELEGFSDW